jgi:hypothetical protein
MVCLLVFHAYINEMHGSRSKILSKKNLVRQHCTEGFNSGVKGLMCTHKLLSISYFLFAEWKYQLCICRCNTLHNVASKVVHLVVNLSCMFIPVVC